MERVQHLVQAYSQAPWRKQLQVIGAFLLILVVVWVVAAIYLDVTARAATIGREIQEMQVRTGGLERVDAAPPETPRRLSIEELEQINADLQTQLASLTSDAVMAERAREMGFQPVEPDDVMYIVVPGYAPPQPAALAPPPGPVTASNPTLAPAYKQSLVDWLREQLTQASALVKGGQP